MSIKLDKTDLKILHILQQDGKITNLELSKQIGLSPAPTLERVRKLENSGVINSYHATVASEALDLKVKTFISVTIFRHKKNSIEHFLEKINNLDEVIECHHVTGTSDFLLKVITSDIPTFEHFLTKRLTNIEEIERLQTMVVLSTSKNSKILPFDYG